MAIPFQRNSLRSFSAFLLSGFLWWGLAGCGTEETDKTAEESNPASTAADAGKAGGDDGKSPIKHAAESADGRTVNADPAAQLQADIDDAISLLEKGDVALFLERYMPLEFLEKVRESSTIEQTAKMLKSEGIFEQHWLEQFRALKTADVEFLDEEKSKARLVANLPLEVTGFPLSVPNPAEEQIPQYEGFTGELPEALEKAIAALKAGEHRKFVENMFPESELYLTTSDEAMQALSARLKEHPPMVEKMIADLSTLQKLTPEYNAEKTIATFQFHPETKQARTVRFEKAGTWRMANAAPDIRSLVYRQSQLPPAGDESATVTEWVRIREHWRLNQPIESNGQ